MFEEMVSSCHNQVQFDEMMEVMRLKHMKYVMSKGNNASIGESTGTILFGEDNTTQKREKRHKFMHERFGNV